MPARKGRGKKKKARKMTETRRAGLTWPVSRVRKSIKDARLAPRISKAAPLYLASILEYCGMYIIYHISIIVI